MLEDSRYGLQRSLRICRVSSSVIRLKQDELRILPAGLSAPDEAFATGDSHSVHQCITGGVVNLSEGHFSGVRLDYALDTTQNKDLKGAGGIIGLTMRSQA